MITGVQDVYYNVTEMERAARFYRDVLGLKVTCSTTHWISLDAGGVTIGLHWTEGSPVAHVPRDAHGAHGGATLTLRSSDIQADEASLRSQGVKILGKIDAPWGKLVIFEDPDGNVLKLKLKQA